MTRRLDLPTLRAALWTVRAVSRVRRSLRRDGLAGARVSAPPPLPAAAARGVHAVLRRRTCSCLEQALVLQSWEAAHGAARDVVIGVRGPTAGFAAHAWVDGMPDRFAGGLHELTRLPPPGRA